MLRLLSGMREVHRVAGPACTLLVLSVLLALVASIARASIAAPAPRLATAELPRALASGDAVPFRLTVEGRPSTPLHAYLPGLDLERVALRYDPATDQYVGEVRIPWYSPRAGRATLRIIGEGVEWDLPLTLAPRSGA